MYIVSEASVSGRPTDRRQSVTRVVLVVQIDDLYDYHYTHTQSIWYCMFTVYQIQYIQPVYDVR